MEIVDDVPPGVDAIALHLKSPSRKPHVILRSDVPRTRLAFTAGHELGHVEIPWHVGRIFSRIEAGDSDVAAADSGWSYALMESEANRFASELLIPNDVRIQVAASCDDWSLANATLAQEAGVSTISAAIALARVAPPNVGFAAIRMDNKITHSGRGPSGYIKVPDRGTALDREALLAAGFRVTSISGRSTEIVWFEHEHAAPSTTGINDDPNGLLRTMLDQLRLPDSRRKQLSQQIHGVIGAANSMHLGGNSAMEHAYQVLRARFAGRDDLEPVLSHPRFDEFLVAKAAKLASK